MGLQKFIEKNLPEHWEKASKKFRCKKDLCNRMYEAIPYYYKGNKLRYSDLRRRAFQYIRCKFEGELIYSINIANADYAFWKAVNDYANIIKEECR